MRAQIEKCFGFTRDKNRKFFRVISVSDSRRGAKEHADIE
jgi:hypothetical protein